MGIAGILHHLVDNSPAFTPEARVQAHKDISGEYDEQELHYMVPSPEAEQAATDEKAAKRAELKRQLAELGDEEESGEPSGPAPVPMPSPGEPSGPAPVPMPTEL